MAVLKDGDTVGHVLSRTTFFFLRHEGSIEFYEVTDERLNLGAQLGVEVPGVYKSYGCRIHVKS